MARTVEEWIGKTDDAKIPDRVRTRIFDAHKGVCYECSLPIGKKKWQLDHRIALINGGKHSETNLGPICIPCHKIKTVADVKTKKKIAKIRGRDTGAKQPKGTIKSAGFAGKEEKPKKVGYLDHLPRRSLFGPKS